MFVMVAGRGQGKTHAIVNWLMEQPGERAVIVNNSREAEYMERLLRQAYDAHRVSQDRWRAFTHDVILLPIDARHWQSLRGRFREIAIDDAERVLQTLFEVPIAFVTMNATLMPTVPARVDPGARKDYVDGEEVDHEEPRWAEEPRSIDWNKLNPAGPGRFA